MPLFSSAQSPLGYDDGAQAQTSEADGAGVAQSETGRTSKQGKPVPDIPDKLYFRIGEVARLLEVPTHVLRFWETEFPKLKPNKGGTGQRLYRRRDVETLLEIRRLLYDQGYTIPGARQLLKDHVQPANAEMPDIAPPEMRSSTEAANDRQTAAEAPAVNDDDELAGTPAEPTDAITVLLNLQTELREIADLLAQPSAGLSLGNAVHRDLHTTNRKRHAAGLLPTLFAPPGNKDDPEQ
ncbi:MAG: MerR family transcriptional regulator [Janthinobacterium lividum]